jgi:hypothetical protein
MVDIAHIFGILNGVFKVVVPPPKTALAKPV